MTAPLGWAVAMTQPNGEGRAVLNLARQGYETYLPRFREVIEEDGRRISKSGVLFSRYVFVFIHDHWHSILGTFGVTSLIKNGDHPATIPASYIDEMKARGGLDGVIDLSKIVPQRAIGSEITVVGGPFYGFKGIYQGQTKEQREAVLLNMLGRQVRVELDKKHIA